MPVPNYTNFVQNPKRIHLIGIGGIGMGALALLCLQRGWVVQGSTLAENAMTQDLRARGALIFLNHGVEHVDASMEAVVYSSAIGEDNPELQAARGHNIPIFHRSDLLRAFVEGLKTVAISGTHGKTTTTSLLGHVLHGASEDPLILSGGVMGAWKSPLYPGRGSLAVVEADESDGSHGNFSQLSGALLTNVEADHMENYGGSLDNLWSGFRDFLQLAQDFTLVCRDAVDPLNPWLQNLSPPITWYGTHPGSDFSAENIRTTPEGMSFDCHTPRGCWRHVVLKLWGHHNVLNALAVVGACVHLGISEEHIRQGLSTFLGVERRLTLVGTRRGIPIIDDYAHHPTEVAAVLETLHHRGYRRILALCQPHRYTRLRDTMDLFVSSFNYAAGVVIFPVYAAGEEPIEGAESKDLAQGLGALGKEVILSSLEDKKGLHDLMDSGAYDVVITLGAGNITDLAKDLVDKV